MLTLWKPQQPPAPSWLTHFSVCVIYSSKHFFCKNLIQGSTQDLLGNRKHNTLFFFYKIKFKFQEKLCQAVCEFLLINHFVKWSALPVEVSIMTPFYRLGKWGSEWNQFAQDPTSAKRESTLTWRPVVFSSPWSWQDEEGSLVKAQSLGQGQITETCVQIFFSVKCKNYLPLWYFIWIA